METKVCNKCGQELPATEEYFYKHPSGKGGLNAQCKECVKARVPKRPFSNKFVDNGNGTTSMYFVDRDKNVDYENVVLIDTADVEYISKRIWVYRHKSVVTREKDYKDLLLAKYLMPESKNKVVFLNNNRFDFRRNNLLDGWNERQSKKRAELAKYKALKAKEKAKTDIVRILKSYLRRTSKKCCVCGRLFLLSDLYQRKSSYKWECKECASQKEKNKAERCENKYIHLGNGETLIVLENQNRGIVGYAKIDTLMYEKCKPYKWHLDYARNREIGGGNTDYVVSTSSSLHRFILGEPPEGYIVDHINRDGLDNRISNLRFATFSQNNMNKGVQKNNSSGYTGVGWHVRTQRWRARIKINRKMIELGYFKKKSDAIKARKEAEIKYFGEFRDKISETAVV